MTPNELRIGNYVEFEGKLYQLASINSDNTIRLKSDDKTHKNYSYGSIGCYAFRELNPIQLTPHLLIDSGFENVNGGHIIETEYLTSALMLYYGTYESDYVYYPQLMYDGDLSETQVLPLNFIKYVHQLQNLYFALTNEELTLKP